MKVKYSYDSLYVMSEKRTDELFKELQERLVESGEDPSMAFGLWPHHYQSLGISSPEEGVPIEQFISQLCQNSACDPDLFIKNIKVEFLPD